MLPRGLYLILGADRAGRAAALVGADVVTLEFKEDLDGAFVPPASALRVVAVETTAARATWDRFVAAAEAAAGRHAVVIAAERRECLPPQLRELEEVAVRSGAPGKLPDDWFDSDEE